MNNFDYKKLILADDYLYESEEEEEKTEKSLKKRTT